MKQKHYDVESIAKLQKTWHMGKYMCVNVCISQTVLADYFLLRFCPRRQRRSLSFLLRSVRPGVKASSTRLTIRL